MSDPSLTALVIAGIVFTLIFKRWAPDLVLGAGLATLLCAGVLSPHQALSGLSEPSIISIALLYILASALQQTGVAQQLGHLLLGTSSSGRIAMTRFLSGVTAMSTFMNNTPIVAMMIPSLEKWSELKAIPSSKVMMMLSYAAILGGTCSLIGSSTNLLIDGMLQQEGLNSLGFFEIARVGLPVALCCIAIMLFLGPKVLPNRESPIPNLTDQRYTIELRVPKNCVIIGKNIEEAGLRHLRRAFLAEIRRGDNVLPAVSPAEVILEDDVLVFVGQSQAVDDLTQHLGLKTIETNHQNAQEGAQQQPRRPQSLRVEVVVSPLSGLIGVSLKDSLFRQKTAAVVLAAARGAERIDGPLGELVLKGGDLLLLETRPAFLQQQKGKDDFIILKSEKNIRQPSTKKALGSLFIFMAMVLAVACRWIGLLEGALVACGMLLATRCISSAQARRAIDLSVVFSIAAAFGLSEAIKTSGLTEHLGQLISTHADNNPLGFLTSVYIITLVTTLLMSNNAAALLIFPLAITSAQHMDIDPRPIAMTITMAASACFATPIGYQTNLMVMGPGGYRFTDYLKLGLPITLVHGVLSVLLIPQIWPF